MKIVDKLIFKHDDVIGSLDAETDSFLNECFFASSVYNTLINFNDSEQSFYKRVILGRTGSGKTALLKQIKTDEVIKRHDVIEAEATVFEHISNDVFLSKLIEEGVDLRVFYKSLWLHVLIVRIIDVIFTQKESFFEKLRAISDRKQWALAKDYVECFRDSFFEEKIIAEITKKVENGVGAALNNKNLGEIKGRKTTEHKERLQTETSRFVSSQLIAKQKNLINFLKNESSIQKRAVISIDDLDKSWLSSNSIRYDFINSLLEAFRELLDISYIKVLISVRTDILKGIYKNSLRQEEKDKSLIIPIEWKKSEIVEILNKRINSLIKRKYESSRSVGFYDIFNFCINGVVSGDYILERTMMRPRDAIDFVNICLAECDGVNEINHNIVMVAERKFYHSRKMALIDEWKTLYENVKSYVDVIELLEEKTFTIKKLKEEKEQDILEYLIEETKADSPFHDEIISNIAKLVELWFEIGLIGILVQDTGIYCSYEKPVLDISDKNEVFIIHPLFYRK